MSFTSDEILALRTLFLSDQQFLAPTGKQFGLSGVLVRTLGTHYRIPVLQLITGLTLWNGREYTTRTLTRYMFSVMIDQWLVKDRDELAHPWRLTDRAERFLCECKRILEEHPDCEPWMIDLTDM